MGQEKTRILGAAMDDKNEWTLPVHSEPRRLGQIHSRGGWLGVGLHNGAVVVVSVVNIGAVLEKITSARRLIAKGKDGRKTYENFVAMRQRAEGDVNSFSKRILRSIRLPPPALPFVYRGSLMLVRH